MNKSGEITLLDFQTYNNTTINVAWYWHKDKQIDKRQTRRFK